MTKLEQLIQAHCPNGVEFKTLENCCQILDNKRKPITRSAREPGPYPYYGANGIQDYVSGYIFDGTFVLVGEDGSVMTEHGNPVVNWAEGKIWVNNHAHIITSVDGKMLRYLYHYLQTVNVKPLIHGNIPKLTGGDFKSIQIPVPPLPVQEEIVRILDKFTELEAELAQELAHRKQQYAFYRDRLLSFESPIVVKTLEELGVFYGGLTGKTKDDFSDGNAKFITYMNVFKNSELDQNANDKVKIDKNEKQHKVQFGDVLFTGSSETRDECGMSSVVTHEPTEDMYLNSFCFGYRLNDTAMFNPHFLKHLFRSDMLRKQIIKTANGVTRFNVSKEKMKQIKIPVPPMNVQNRLAYVLDNFDAICSDLSIGLPAEIAAREKQYNYYRDLLFNYAADMAGFKQSKAEQSRAEQSKN